MDRPGGGIRLAAFLVASGPLKPDVTELRELIRTRLAPPAVPSSWISLADIPRGRTGKIDRSWLKEQASGARFQTNPDTAPTTAVQKAIHGHCCEILGISELGIDDDLVSLGLDSLMLAELQARIAGLVQPNPTLTSMMQNPTVRALSSSATENHPLVHFRSPDATTRPEVRFVLLPGAGGHELAMRPLADHLAPHGSVRVVAAREYTSVRTLVNDTIAALKREVTGDLVFIGHSLGGQFAMEIAHQSQRMGLRASSVVLLDSFAPESTTWFERLRVRISPRYRLTNLREGFRQGLRRRLLGARRSDAHRRRRAFSNEINERFLRQVVAGSVHEWKRADVSGLLLRSTVGDSASPEESAEQWRPWFLRDLSEIIVAGEHSTMIEEPYVSQVATHILDWLAQPGPKT